MPYYIATVFLLHGLAPIPGVAFNFLIAVCALLLAIFNRRFWHDGLRFRRDDRAFLAVYVLGLLPLLLRPSSVGIQNVLYSLQWIGVWLVCFWWVREWLIATRTGFARISAAAAVGCMILSVAVITEFLLANTAGLYLSDFVHFSIDVFPPADVFEDALRRPRGFASEAGFTAIAFECLAPLSLHWMLQGTLRRWFYPALVIPAYLLLFSAASLTFLVVVVLTYIAIFKGRGRAAVMGLLVFGLIAVAVISSDAASFVVYEVFLRKYLEFSPAEIITGADTFSRPEAYSLALDILRERPFGIGWGGVSQQFANGQALLGVPLKGTGLISLPLEIGACAGIGGLLIYACILYVKLARIARLPGLPARLTFISLLWVTLHHCVVLEFWFPMLWLSMAIADALTLNALGEQAALDPGHGPVCPVATTAS